MLIYSLMGIWSTILPNLCEKVCDGSLYTSKDLCYYSNNYFWAILRLFLKLWRSGKKKTKNAPSLTGIALHCKHILVHRSSLVLYSAGWVLNTWQKISMNFKTKLNYRVTLQINVIRGMSPIKRVSSYGGIHLK